MRTIALLVLLCLAWPAYCKDKKPKPKPPKIPRVFPEQIVAPDKGFRMSSRILFVVDVSGSMRDGKKLRQAIDSVLLIVGSGVDGFRVGAIAFTHGFSRWAGVPQCKHKPTQGHNKTCVPPGWAEIPTDYRAVLAWLSTLAALGGTEPRHAFHQALQDPTRDLTVVLISDGEFDAQKSLRQIERDQVKRIKRGLRRVPIMVWGAGVQARTQKSLRAVAEVGGGGFWVHGKRRSGPW